VIPYGAALADDGARPAREAFAGPDDEPVRVLFVGRLVERKGVEVLVRAIAEGRETFGRPVELRIVGSGAWSPKIAAAIEEHGLGEPAGGESGDGGEGRDGRDGSPSGPYENGFSQGAGHTHADTPVDTPANRGETPDRPPARAVLLGRLSDAALRHEYVAADVLVLPAVRDAKGDTEGLGVVLLEALRFERPVVGSDIGGIPDIIRDGETGILCPPGDSGALAATLAELIRNPEGARELAQRGRIHAAATFGWAAVVGATTAAYERAVKARRGGG
jgi:glycosyltransferase involved in cell wall biosynthesis